MVGEQEHRARSLDVPIHVLYTLLEGLALDDEQRHELRRVCAARRHLGEMHVLLQHLVCQLILVEYLRHRADGKFSQVRIHYQRLSVGVADYADSRCSPLEAVESRLKLGAEI